jgi:hypothetical protein
MKIAIKAQPDANQGRSAQPQGNVQGATGQKECRFIVLRRDNYPTSA